MPLRPPAGYIRPGYNPLQVANAPTVGTASAGDTTASVAFTAPSNVGGGAISLYYAVSSPGQITATSVTSPVTVTGLTNGTSYTFTVWAANPFGPSPYSASSNSVTPSFTYIEDVFSTYLYTGNGSTTQAIPNGVDLSTYGGLVWEKVRNVAGSHYWSTNGINVLSSNTTGAASGGGVTFTTNGYTLNSSYGAWAASSNLASWTFRKQPKFFDVVTWTGNGANPRQIAHNLGSVPGCIIVKSTTRAENWTVYHRSLGNAARMALNTTDAQVTGTGVWGSTTPTSTHFTVSADNLVNFNGDGYVAYLFAHDAGGFGLTGTDNVISCGSYTGNGSTTGPSISLGYEPQWLMIKRAVGGTSAWNMYDTMRGMPVPTAPTFVLQANSSGVEYTGPNYFVAPTATGFDITSTSSDVNTNGSTYIYIAIRRGPMKTPTTGTSVYQGTTRTGTGAAASISGLSFPPDMVITRNQNSNGSSRYAWYNKLAGATRYLDSAATDAEFTVAQSLTSFNQTGESFGTGAISNFSGDPYINWQFRRAPSFLDVVCYTGTGASPQSINHNLGVPPELWIVKSRTAGATFPEWWIGTSVLPLFTARVDLNFDNTAAQTNNNVWNDTLPTSTVFYTGNALFANESGYNYVAYLFASCPGVSKVGSYTGTGALQTINCGFTGGARWVLIKRTDSTGDWFVYDSARGISSGNDPYLLLNTFGAEVQGTNYVDTTSVGFQVTAAAPAGLNANGGTYIFLAIA